MEMEGHGASCLVCVLRSARGGAANVLSHGATCPVCPEDFNWGNFVKTGKSTYLNGKEMLESATAFPLVKRVSSVSVRWKAYD